MNNPFLFMLGVILPIIGFCLALASSDGQPSSNNDPDNPIFSAIDLQVNFTQIYHQTAKGGRDTQRRDGRLPGSLDIEMTADLQRLLGIESAEIYLHTESAWPRRDYNDLAVGSLWGVNSDFAGRQDFSIIELWYQQSFFENAIRLRAGKLDMAGGFEHRGCPVSFDCNAYANDENSQFLNPALVNNPTIPFPDFGLGAILLYSPVDIWYISIGAADAQADRRETGLNTAFHNRADFAYMAESGLLPSFNSPAGDLQGAYRVGLWYDPKPTALGQDRKTYRDNVGWYISVDQMVFKEKNGVNNGQGLGLFARYGYAPSRAYPVSQFVSAGIQYKGLLAGRDDDTFGVGWAKGYTSDAAKDDFASDYESVFETYYNIALNPKIYLTPSIQYIQNPGADGQTRNAAVVALRLAAQF